MRRGMDGKDSPVLPGLRNMRAMMKPDISRATQRNWTRLRTDGRKRLTKRANKRRSTKRILPLEYVSDPAHIPFVRAAAGRVRREKIPLSRAIFSFAAALLERKGILGKPHVQAVLQEYASDASAFRLCPPLPEDEWDILGLLYQSMLPEGSKNRNGSYYTPESVAVNMTRDFDFSHGETFLDPCCGSGSFLLALPCHDPERIFGFDRDPVAVFIAKVNLLLRFSDREFTPQIFRMNYLGKHSGNALLRSIRRKTFDYIATNPPWGAVSRGARIPREIRSGESFSCFFVNARHQLKDSGLIRFLFPESLLNVKNHRDLRSFLLNCCELKRITLYDGTFSGVTTKYIDVLCGKHPPTREVYFRDPSGLHRIPADSFRMTDNFSFLTHADLEILRKIKAKGRYDLSGSIWALGIVTGDNRDKLKCVPEPGFEAIYTGKEIERYSLRPPENYLLYDRTKLQQIAREEYYRAPEKLVYKFISDKPVFAYDNTGSLFLNSANILIPSVPGMSIKTVLAFLNSALFRFFYTRIFGEVKVLKGNLVRLPFPEISPEQDRRFEFLVKRILDGDAGADSHLQDAIEALYDLTPEQTAHVRRIPGKTGTHLRTA